MARGDGPSTAGHDTTQQPPPGFSTDLAVPADPVRRFGPGKPRRVPGGGMAESSGETWEWVFAADGDLRACPSVDRPATPRPFDQSHRG